MKLLTRLIAALRSAYCMPTLTEVKQRQLQLAQLDLVNAANQFEDARAHFDMLKARVQRLERELA